jgi:hypothetical protein
VTGSDDEFEDFLRRRKPIFRAPDDMFEPPAEIDRIVLRQAREAIETERPMRVFRAPRWATPLALAATLVLAFTIIFQVGMPQKREPVAEVTVQSVARRADYQDAATPAVVAPMAEVDSRASGAAAASNEAVVELSKPMTASREMAAQAPAPASSADGLVAREESERYAAPPPPAAPIVARNAADTAADTAAGERRADTAADAPPLAVSVPAAKATEIPTWRRDSKAWLAEIERLRNAGDSARADAELEEYKRQHRALAVAPDQ